MLSNSPNSDVTRLTNVLIGDGKDNNYGRPVLYAGIQLNPGDTTAQVALPAYALIKEIVFTNITTALTAGTTLSMLVTLQSTGASSSNPILTAGALTEGANTSTLFTQDKFTNNSYQAFRTIPTNASFTLSAAVVGASAIQVYYMINKL